MTTELTTKIHKIGIELCSATLLKLPDNRLHRKLLPVRSIRSHRVGRIRNHDDSCTEWNRFARYSIRISVPIPAFVVTPYSILDCASETRDNPDQIGALRGVRLQ